MSTPRSSSPTFKSAESVAHLRRSPASDRNSHHRQHPWNQLLTRHHPATPLKSHSCALSRCNSRRITFLQKSSGGRGLPARMAAQGVCSMDFRVDLLSLPPSGELPLARTTRGFRRPQRYFIPSLLLYSAVRRPPHAIGSALSPAERAAPVLYRFFFRAFFPSPFAGSGAK